MALTRPRIEQFNTAVSAISDPITVLKAGTAQANVDIGFVMNRANGLVSNVALYWSESGNTFITAFTSNSGVTNSNITPTSYVTFTTGTIVANGVDILANIGQQYDNNTAQTNSILGANAAIVAANTALKNYADYQITTANTALKNYADYQITTANTSLKGYVDAGNTTMTTFVNDKISAVNSSIATTNANIGGYYLWANANVAGLYSSITGANVTISALQANVGSFYTYANATYSTIANAATLQNQIIGANLAIVTANTALKGYVDSANTVQSNQIIALQNSVYTNANVDAYLRSTGAGNITILSGAFSLPATGPGAVTVGSGTAIPVITTDAYGRITALTSSAVSTTINTTGTTGTGSVSGGGTLTFTSTNGVAVAASGSTLSISTPQNLQTTATPTFAGATINGATQVNGTLSASGVTSITNNTNSTGAGNGALVVTGGIGASGTVNFGSDLYVTGNIYTANLVATTTSTLNTSSPMAYFQVTPSYPYNFETGFYSHFVGGPANVYAHTGFVRNHNNNYWTIFSNVKTEPGSSTINFADAGIIYDTLYAGGAILANATPSTSVSSGALVVTGGAGINGNLNVNSAGYFGYNASQTPLVNPSIVGTQSSQAINAGQYYVQMALINNTGTGSADITAYPNNVTDGSSAFMDMGFTGNLYSDPAYTITKANDGYLFASAKDGAGLGGNLVLATDRTGTFNDIVVAVGSFYSNSEVARFHGNTSTGGYLQLSQTTTATSTTTGALRVDGGVGITGNIYADKVYSTNGLFWASNGYAISTGGGSSAAGLTGALQYNNAGALAAAPLYYWSGNTNITTTSSVYAPAVYDNSNRVLTSVTVTAGTGMSGGGTITGPSGTVTLTNAGVTGLSSSGAGNLTVSASTGAVTVSLPATGPGAVTTGSSTAIPVITTDAYGRIAAISTSSVSTTISLAGTTGSGSVSGGGTLTFAGSNGFTATVSGSTITLADPQNLQTSASPTFAGGNFTGNVTRSSRTIVTNYSGNVAPSSPLMGDEWFRGNTGVMYKYLYDNVSNTYNWINISSALYNASTSATASTLALRDTGGNLTATNFLGTASSAKYADLAEIYASDKPYLPGTVVVFGGTKEVTTTTKTHDTRVAGVVSTNPAYLMNSEATGVPVAFTGRVPCYVRGPVTKGDVLVTSAHERYAERLDDALYRPGCVLGKALGEVAEYEFATIEVVVGRF